MSTSLTDLPNCVVDEILVRLPLREAVRTSVLSRAWRHRWQFISELVIEDEGGELPAAAIDTVLFLHSGPVRRFSLDTTDPAHTDRWMISLSRRAAGHLLSLSLVLRRLYPLHSSVLSFRKTLTHLNLEHCSLPHPPCSFPALRSLRLIDVQFPDDRQLSVLISGCPALERLSLINARPCGSLRVHSPNLRSLELYDIVCDRIELMSGQTLHEFVADLTSEDTDVELAVLFRGVVCENKLSLQESTMMALAKGSIPESMITTFQRLRRLRMDLSLVVPSKIYSQISVMLCLMRSAPNLQHLFVFIEGYATGSGEAIWRANQSLELFASLLSVKIMTQEPTIQEPVMEFMRFILARAQVLETLTISSDEEVTTHHESALAELLEFPRISARARIILKKKEEDEIED